MLTRELLRAVVARKPAPGGEVPRLELAVPRVAVEAPRLERYRQVCGFAPDVFLPLTYPQVLAMPMHLALLNRPEFPYRLLGMVHVRNRVRQHRRLPVSAMLQVRVWLEGRREAPRGSELDLHTRVELEGEVAWEAVTTMLRRDGRAEASRGPRRVPSPADVAAAEARFAHGSLSRWAVGEDVGWRYARASGDYNPIHLHPLLARPFGFPRAIAHGMWTVGRAVAQLGAAAEAPALTLTSDFKKPLLLPSRVVFRSARGEGGALVHRVADEDGRVHLEGEMRPGER
jgi:acyl dehydratase